MLEELPEELHNFVEVCYFRDLETLKDQDFFIMFRGRYKRVKEIVFRSTSCLLVDTEGHYEMIGEYSYTSYILTKHIMDLFPEELL